MGFGGISIWQLLIILLIVVMLFGTKRLKSLGSDLGDAIKGFRKSVNADEEKAAEEQKTQANQQVPNQQQGTVINGEARKVEDPAKKD
ncbi:MAG TPA: twin-arginine translocase TatA/TatE family subunit [Pseudomonas sp.]|jgi:sec-independent protein translocase protein TatA|uniref:twin-arginine translocase TatA/TatE family subunit n=1 Tax=Pseudomonas sp. TaxID=306 RepID=UPI002CA35BD5|nr:twin-arginine translocase TatA/TatE family subunit [Pseudomonas sp.]HTO18436.1 twin-arginine translocase TatA/TatE family subunit [Pseudomonas sp.]